MQVWVVFSGLPPRVPSLQPSRLVDGEPPGFLMVGWGPGADSSFILGRSVTSRLGTSSLMSGSSESLLPLPGTSQSPDSSPNSIWVLERGNTQKSAPLGLAEEGLAQRFAKLISLIVSD